jgi:hypothetical protein
MRVFMGRILSNAKFGRTVAAVYVYVKHENRAKSMLAVPGLLSL